MRERSVITIAAGKSSYFKMALSLARSMLLSNSTIPLYIVTDLDIPIPPELKNVRLLKYAAGQVPRGFSAKLSLDRYVQTQETLFVDADCIVLQPLAPLFDAFLDRPVGVLGVKQYEGEWFGDTKEIRDKLNLPYRPYFNGGVYYLRRSDELHQIFSRARELEKRYDEIGFRRLRGQPNEEPLISAAMAELQIEPLFNDGRYYADFQWWPQLKRLDVLSGVAELRNPAPPHQSHQSAFPAAEARPLVLHFLGHHIDAPVYVKARIALFLKCRKVPMAGALATVWTLPLFFREVLKNALRPAYRAVFGYRRIKESGSRLIID